MLSLIMLVGHVIAQSVVSDIESTFHQVSGPLPRYQLFDTYAMAAGRRKSNRVNAQTSIVHSSQDPPIPVEPNGNETHPDGHAEPSVKGSAEDDKCPACEAKDAKHPNAEAVDKESWVRCDACKTWFHWRCVGEGGDLEAVDKWCAVFRTGQACGVQILFAGSAHNAD
jgi:hypothetical protein